jgi:hypothetical protein
MGENDLILEIAKLLSGSPSVWVSILLAGVVLKKYVINGSIKTFLDLKDREVKSLNALEANLEKVIAEQQKLYEKICVAK